MLERVRGFTNDENFGEKGPRYRLLKIFYLLEKFKMPNAQYKVLAINVSNVFNVLFKNLAWAFFQILSKSSFSLAL